MARPLIRRGFLQGALGLATRPIFGKIVPAQAGHAEGSVAQVFTKEIVMLHGASEGGWCFDPFRTVFEGLGWTCHTPDLIGHGEDAVDADRRLVGVGMAQYLSQMRDFLQTFASPPVLLGHSLGAVLAQQLAASGLTRALILVSPAPRAGILPATDAERQLALDLMTLGPFWSSIIKPDFDLACIYSLNRVPPGERRALFDRFGPESGRAYFELFFWIFDQTEATVVDTAAVRCPVLCLSGDDDKLISMATARATAAAFRTTEFWELAGHGHMLPVEPGAEAIARRIARWIPA
ncbi:MAG: alpha/beta hydrolase [Methyloceanibacter sp.]